MTYEYSAGSAAEYARQMAAGLAIDMNACDAAGRAAEQAQRDSGTVEPLEIDSRNKRQFMSIHQNNYGDSVWRDR